jgi:hypothetical protein
MASGRPNSVHVLVHARVRHYCLLLRLPAKLYRQTGLSFCERYANPCVDMRLAATFRVLDSKSADRKIVGVRPPLPAPDKAHVIWDLDKRRKLMAWLRTPDYAQTRKVRVSSCGGELDDASVTLERCARQDAAALKGSGCPRRITLLETSSFIVPPHGPALI